MRLSRGRQFMSVYGAKVRSRAWPLLVHGMPNDLGYSRLGLAVPRRVGGAVVRNAIKRRLREAFRLSQHDWPAPERGYDVVISVRPHEPLTLAAYQEALHKAMQDLHTTWTKRIDKHPGRAAAAKTPPCSDARQSARRRAR